MSDADWGPSSGKTVYHFSLVKDLLDANKKEYTEGAKFQRPIQDGRPDAENKEIKWEYLTLKFTSGEKHWYPVYYSPASLWRNWIENTPKSGLLTGYFGWRFYANHMAEYTNSTSSYKNIAWLSRFYFSSDAEKNYDTLMSITPKSGSDPSGETLIMVMTADLGYYKPGAVTLDLEIYDTTSSPEILKYKQTLYNWSAPRTAQSPLHTVEEGTGNAWCQWSCGDYDPAPHSEFLTFFVEKNHKYKTKFSIYANGRNWDGAVGFADGSMSGHCTEVVYANKDLAIY